MNSFIPPELKDSYIKRNVLEEPVGPTNFTVHISPMLENKKTVRKTCCQFFSGGGREDGDCPDLNPLTVCTHKKVTQVSMCEINVTTHLEKGQKQTRGNGGAKRC